MVKVIFFDIDNTLMDFMEMKDKSCNEAIDAMIGAGLKVKKEKMLKGIYELYDKHGMEDDKIFQKLLKKETGKIDYRILAYGVIAYRNLKETYIVPYAKVMSTLLKLGKTYRLAVITDAPRTRAWMRLVRMKLDPFFELVLTKGYVKAQKDTATPFRVALKKLKIKPNETIMVGDRISRDIKTPKKLGIKTCYARYGDLNPAKIGKSGADFEINNLSELVDIVKKLE